MYVYVSAEVASEKSKQNLRVSYADMKQKYLWKWEKNYPNKSQTAIPLPPSVPRHKKSWLLNFAEVASEKSSTICVFHMPIESKSICGNEKKKSPEQKSDPYSTPTLCLSSQEIMTSIFLCDNVIRPIALQQLFE